jgi:hypothetical protein
MPQARDYRVTLAATTQPVRDYSFVQAITPSVMSDISIQDDRPIRADVIGVALKATTSPVQPRAPPPAAPTSTPSEMSDLSIQEDLPRRPDYSRAIASTSSVTGPKLPYDPAAIALFGQMSVQPDDARKILYNNLIVSLKNAGVWDRLDVLYVTAVGTEQQANLNWKKPGTFTATSVGTPTFTADVGVTGLVSTNYKTANWIPSSNAVQYTLNDASAFAWSSTNTQVNGSFIFIDEGGTSGRCACDPWRVSPSNSSCTLNSSGGGSGPTPPSAEGLFTWTRADATNIDCYRNTTNLGQATGAGSVAVPTVSMTFGGDPRGVKLFGAGASLSAQNITDLYNAFNTYFTAIPITPAARSDLAIAPSWLQRPDYSRSLESTTHSVSPYFIPPVVVTPPWVSVTTPEPLRADYRTTLESTTHPVRDYSFVQAITPTTPVSVITPDPIRPDYSRALEATTHPISPPQPPPPAQTPTFLFDLSIQEELPRRTDYRQTLNATTLPVGPELLPTATPTVLFDLAIQEDVPRRADYSRALASTSQPVVPIFVPIGTATPSSYFDLTVQEDVPRRPDYSRALAATTLPVRTSIPPASAVCALWDVDMWDVGTWCAGSGVPTPAVMSAVINEQPPPRPDYSRALAPTIQWPRVVPPPAVPQPTAGFELSIQEDRPRRPDYRVMLADTTEPVMARDPCTNIVINPGFELSGTIDLPWRTFGAATFLVDTNPAESHTGNNSGQIFVASSPTPPAFVDLEQTVNVQANTDYTLSGWICSDATTQGIFGAQNMDGSFTCKQQGTGFDNREIGANPPTPALYTQYKVFFNSGPNTQLIIFAAFVPPANVASSINLDDVRLVPAVCDPLTPSTFIELSIQDDLPRRADYSRALAPSPVGPTLLPTGVPQLSFWFNRQQNPPPLTLDYRAAVSSTTYPVCVPFQFVPTATPAELPDLSVQDDRPYSANYRIALGSTTSPVGPALLPTSTPDTRADVITPAPIRPDYSRTLEATTHPVGQLVGSFAAVITPVFGWRPGSWPMPIRPDYWTSLESTTHPIVPLSFRTAVTPVTSFFGPSSPQYIQRTFWTILAASSGFTAPYVLPPPPPPPPPSCIVTFGGVPGSAPVALSPGASSVVTMGGTATGTLVTLVSGGTENPVALQSTTDGTVPLVKNPGCP